MKILFAALTIIGGLVGNSAMAAEGAGSLHDTVTLIPTVGVSIFNLVGGGGSSNSTGFVGGILGDFNLGKDPFRIETGLLYLQEGGSDNGVTLTINYLAIPVLAKYSFAIQDGFAFHVKGGLMPSFMVGSKTSGSGITVDTSSLISSFDLQLALGVGIKYDVNEKFGLTLDLMYDRGLLNVAKNGSDTVNNQGFMVMVGAAL